MVESCDVGRTSPRPAPILRVWNTGTAIEQDPSRTSSRVVGVPLLPDLAQLLGEFPRVDVGVRGGPLKVPVQVGIADPVVLERKDEKRS